MMMIDTQTISRSSPATGVFRTAVSLGLVEHLDAALARWIADRDPERAAEIGAAALLLSMARRAGDTSLRLSDLEQNAHVLDLIDADVPLPSPDDIRDAVAASQLVGPPEGNTPLVLAGDLLFLRRFWDGEQSILDSVRCRLASHDEARDAAQLRAVFERLFRAGATDEPNWQAIAAAAALRSRFLCIAGGPGTGKTTTVVRVMAVLLEIDPELRIGLAAPTGKAANRMAGSIAEQLDYLPLDDELKDRIPRTASTLHRLLAFRPSQARFAYGNDRRLGSDVVIVDEASMIDHQLFTAMLAALPDHARLILLGDPDQLPSVDAGFVFGELCRAGSGSAKSEEFVRYASALGLTGLPDADPNPPLMRDAVVTLTRAYRFGPNSGIGAAAYALRDGDGEKAVDVLTSTDFEDVQLAARSEQNRVIRQRIRPYAEALLRAASPAEALAHLDRMRVLSPVRIGAEGVIALNEEIEQWLLEERIRPYGDHYAGKPVLITTNDYEVSLFNGDVGVLWKNEERFVGCFADGEGGVREVPLHRLPPHEVAWAMTVHKSQGSEFDDVVLILPEKEHAGRLTRELLYTAVTRAKESVTIIGEADVILTAAARNEERVTGLRAALE